LAGLHFQTASMIVRKCVCPAHRSTTRWTAPSATRAASATCRTRCSCHFAVQTSRCAAG
jgi:hypothetical protein